jgi:hypothetical protein
VDVDLYDILRDDIPVDSDHDDGDSGTTGTINEEA